MGSMRLVMTALCASVAMLAVCVGSVASASAAEPAFYECAKTTKENGKYKGHYSDSSCTVVNTEGTGEYELQEGVGKGKAGRAKSGPMNWEVKGLGGWTCTSNSWTGWKWVSPKVADGIVITFKGCQVNTVWVTSEGAKEEGEVITAPLKAEIAYTEGGATKHEVGVLLTPETGSYLVPMMHFWGDQMRLAGGIVGVVTSPSNVVSNEMTLLFKETAGVQAVRRLEGFSGEYSLETEINAGSGWGGPAPTGWEYEVTIKGEKLMLKA